VTDSGGLTQREFAELFIAFGADQAMEFDGGGSASLWIDEGFVNDFGYRGERRVTNSLMLFWEE
jgi:exopolysaccharide biosynthesis protein